MSTAYPDAPGVAVAAGGDPATAAEAWYCLRAQPKHEAIAAAHLRKLAGVEVFCPRVRFQRPRRRTGVRSAESSLAWQTEAMFPGYLFARFELATRDREIQHAHGVRGLVRFGRDALPIPTAIIESLQASAGPQEVATVASPLEAGQEVEVASGAFSGLRVVVTHYLPARQRVRVLLEFMGREMEAEIAASGVVAPFVHPLYQKRIQVTG